MAQGKAEPQVIPVLTAAFNLAAIAERFIPLATRFLDWMVEQRAQAKQRTNPPFRVRGPQHRK